MLLEDYFEKVMTCCERSEWHEGKTVNVDQFGLTKKLMQAGYMHL